jgi:hypothetical protein
MSLDHIDEITHEPRLLFTEPWDPIVVRRGDALGLLALTNVFAEAVAPGLSNRVRDGRWVTIMAVVSRAISASLPRKRKQIRIHAGRAGQAVRMAAAARTHVGCQNHRSGRRRLEGAAVGASPAVAAMVRTPIGGTAPTVSVCPSINSAPTAYRVAFRKWPEMTIGGDGWTPGPAANKLEKWLDVRLGSARPEWHL